MNTNATNPNPNTDGDDGRGRGEEPAAGGVLWHRRMEAAENREDAAVEAARSERRRNLGAPACPTGGCPGPFASASGLCGRCASTREASMGSHGGCDRCGCDRAYRVRPGGREEWACRCDPDPIAVSCPRCPWVVTARSAGTVAVAARRHMCEGHGAAPPPSVVERCHRCGERVVELNAYHPFGRHAVARAGGRWRTYCGVSCASASDASRIRQVVPPDGGDGAFVPEDYVQAATWRTRSAALETAGMVDLDGGSASGVGAEAGVSGP